MRKPLLLLCLATGCMFGDRSEDRPNGPGTPPRPDAGIADPPGPTPDACAVGCWVAVQFPPALPFGAGMEYRVSLQKTGTGGVVFDVSDPAIVEIVAVVLDGSSKHVRVRGKSPGTAMLTARHAGNHTLLNTTVLTVEHVADVHLQFRSGPGLDAPVGSLAALPGTSDSFAIVYLDSAGNRLSGSGGFVTTGGVSIDPMGPGLRPSNYYTGIHARVAVAIDGSGTVATTLADDPRQFVWPIEVVPAPATFSMVSMYLDSNSMLVPLPATGVKRGSFVGADVIGRTADGRFVAGVEALWSASAGLTPFLISTTSPESEGVFQAQSSGTFSAVAGGTTYTQQVIVTP
jgi:hypothetical protein